MSLPGDTPVRVAGDPRRAAFKPDGLTANPSYTRRAAYRDAQTVAGLGALDGARWADVAWDLARGHILVDSKALLGRPRPPPDARTAAVATAKLGDQLDGTLREIARLEALEDGPADGDVPGWQPRAYRAQVPRVPSCGWSPVERAARDMLAVAIGSLRTPEPALDLGPDDCDPSAYELPVAAAAFALRGGAAVGPMETLPTTAREARLAPDYEGVGGWKSAIQDEVIRVASYGALKRSTMREYRELRRRYGDRVTRGHLVLALKVKRHPDGTFDRRKGRLAIADKREKQGSAMADFYSACADPVTDKVSTQIAVNEGGVQHTVDVGAAFFRARPLPVENGGRALLAFVPAWLSDYGDYPTHDENGEPYLLYIDANMPGRRDAGRIWEECYDAFLLGPAGLRQCVYDLRCFYRADTDGWLIVYVHVDDTRITASSVVKVREFVELWEAEFEEESDHTELSEFFCGVLHRRVGDTCELSVGTSMDNLAEILSSHPLPPGFTCAYPLSPDAPAMLRLGVTARDPLVPHLLPVAQRLCGLATWVTVVRYEVLLSLRMLSRHVSEDRLTSYVFRELLRLAHYLVRTREVPLVIRAVPEGTQIRAWFDSSLANSPDGLSWGGCCVGYEGSGALLCLCTTPSKAADSSGVCELNQAVQCVKAVLGLRIFLRELDRPPVGPTMSFTDAQVLLDGTHCRKVSKESKWVAPRYAIVRKAEADGAVTVCKIGTSDNRADLFTKPLFGTPFERHRASVLGLRL